MNNTFKKITNLTDRTKEGFKQATQFVWYNVLRQLKSSYSIVGLIIFLIIVLSIVYSDAKLTSVGGPTESQDKIVGRVFIVLFFTIIVLSICIVFLPSMKDFRALFQQISSVSYVVIYTIFAILFYTMIPDDIMNNYSFLINPFILGLGAFAFYKGLKASYIENFNIGYERIKMLIIFFCLITFIITFYNTNPGGVADKYFGYSLLLTIILAVFAFLYLIIIMTLPGEEGSESTGILSKTSKFWSTISLSFFVFLIIMTILITTDRANLFANKERASTIMIILLLICILWSVLMVSNIFSGEELGGYIKRINLLKKSLIVLFGLVISGLLIYWITYNIESLSGSSSITKFVLNMALVVIVLGLIYKVINVQTPSGNTRRNTFFNLILSIIFYIPCLASGVFDWMGSLASGPKQAENVGSLMMLLVALGLIIAYFKTPSLFNFISTQGGNQLVNKPVYTDTLYNLGSYIDLNDGKDEFDYQYAISCWVFIDAAGPNMNASYNKYTSLLNFGNKPNILYHGKDNTIMITMQQKDLKNETNNKLTDFDDNGNRIIYTNKNVLLQKWNNIIINYNGGTFDVFLNGELVKSAIEVVPYYTYDNLTIGENEGIKGGICNVVYFKNALTSQNVFYIYNSLKGRDPPVLNDSNKTILVKELNQAKDSINSST